MESTDRRAWRPFWIAVAPALVFLTFWYTWPLAIEGVDRFPYNSGDTALITAGLRLHWHQLLTDPTQLGDDRIFYPLSGTAFFKDLELSAVLPFGLFLLVTGQPIQAASYTLLLAMAATAIAMAALAYRWTGDRLASLTAGSVWAFSPILFSYLGHYQLVYSCWTPLALIALDSFLARPRLSAAVAGLLCLWLQFVTAVYWSFYAVIAGGLYVLVWCAARWRAGERPGGLAVRKPSARTLARVGFFVVLAAVLFVPPLRGYQGSARLWDAQRTLDDVMMFSASPLSFFNPADVSWLYGGSILRSFAADSIGDWEKRLFAGVLPIGLALFAAWTLARGRLAQASAVRALTAVVLVVVGAVLALGPYPVMNGRVLPVPLPYLLLYHLAPGFQSMRSPARFALMSLIGLALLAALAIVALRSRRRARWLVPALVLVTLGELTTARIPMSPPLDVFPQSDLALLDQRDGPLAWLPIDGPRVGGLLAYVEAARMLQSPIDRQLVNGYSGFIPPPYLDFQRMTAIEEPELVVAALSQLGVRTLAFDAERVDPPRLREWTPELARLPSLGPTERLRVLALPAPRDAAPAPRVRAVAGQVAGGVVSTIWLDLINDEDVVWVNRRPAGKENVSVSWTTRDGAKVAAATVRAAMPLYVRPRGSRSVELAVTPPSTPGYYKLEVRLGDRIDVRDVEVVAQPPSTSKDNSPSLRGALELTGSSAAGALVAAGGPLHVQGRAENRGESVWLSRALRAPVGTVRVGALWLPAHDGPSLAEQRIELERDAPPGSTVAFHGVLRVPATPGDYRLKLAPVVEGVAWLDEAPRGQAIFLTVTVVP